MFIRDPAAAANRARECEGSLCFTRHMRRQRKILRERSVRRGSLTPIMPARQTTAQSK